MIFLSYPTFKATNLPYGTFETTNIICQNASIVFITFMKSVVNESEEIQIWSGIRLIKQC